MENLTHQSKTIQVDIPQEEIWRTTDYYPGYVFSSLGRVYTYKSNPNRLINGRNSNGYIQLDIKDYNNEIQHPCLSRIIYMLFGDEPELLPYRHVDHIRRLETTNNNINNLRLATPRENEANKGKQSVNYQGTTPSSSYVGCTWNRFVQKWQASIKIKGKSFYLSRYKHPENGAYVYSKVAKSCKPPKHWKNNLPANLQLPEDTENREQVIANKINEIQNWLNQQ